MPPHTSWSEREQLAVMRLYCRTPFGRLHKGNPAIVALASLIGRTPSAVAMKACNFASLDPVESRRVRGLGNASRADRELWDRFRADSEAVADAAETAWAELGLDRAGDSKPLASQADRSQVTGLEGPELPSGETESVALVHIRRVQGFFRASVLVAYENRCAITGIAHPNLLNASHIIPWKNDQARRADPTNGLCLNALHDRAFDRGLITVDERMKIVVASSLLEGDHPDFHRAAFADIHGQPLKPPVRFHPDMTAMAWHRDHVFKG